MILLTVFRLRLISLLCWVRLSGVGLLALCRLRCMVMKVKALSTCWCVLSVLRSRVCLRIRRLRR